MKNLKHVAQLSFLKKNLQTNKLELGMAKIPVIFFFFRINFLSLSFKGYFISVNFSS